MFCLRSVNWRNGRNATIRKRVTSWRINTLSSGRVSASNLYKGQNNMFIQNRYTFALLLLLLFSTNLVYGQTDKGFLKKNKIVKTDINHTEKHRYQVKLKKNQFAEFRLVQNGIDLMITTYNSRREKVGSFDLTSNFGEELITISSDIAGNYSLEVQPFASRKASGKYSLEIKKISRKAKTASEKVDQYLARWDSSVSPGLGVAVVKDGKIIHNKGYGMANLEHNIPINQSTVFEMASVSKQFTALFDTFIG